MTDPGLTRRLRQQAHRSGLAVGLSMAIAIAVCIGGFTWLYVQLDPWVRDFAGAEPAPTATARAAARDNDERADKEQQDEEEPAEEERPTRTPEPEEDENDIQPVEEDNGDFNSDYQITALEQVNMRSGPGRSFDIVVSLNPGTPLEFTGNREPAPDAEDSGLDWLEFETEDGQQGWIRDIDVGET